MRIDQLALLLGIVLTANLVLLIALELPRLGRRRRERELAGSAFAFERLGEEFSQRDGVPFRGALTGDRPALPDAVYQRVVRVVSLLFIGAVLVVASVTGGPTQIPLLLLLALGAFLIVLFQDLLPDSGLRRWRLAFEAAAAILFLTALLILSGGFASPYFFGYILFVGAAALWSSSIAPLFLTALTSVAYVTGVLIAGPLPLPLDALSQVSFNLVALALITYVATVVGREQRRARDEALRLSRMDPLTGLYSRAYLVSSINQEIRRATRSGRAFSLLMIDLDGLKAANDRFGHDSGDALLRAVAEVLHGDVRATDVAARYGGDEFVLILPETDVNGAALVAEKVRVDIARIAVPHNGNVVRTSASIGLVTYPDDGRTASELVRKADLAMYEAKRRGRDQIVRFARRPAPPQEPRAQRAGGPSATRPGTHGGQPIAVPVEGSRFPGYGAPGYGTPSGYGTPPAYGSPPAAQPARPPAPWDSTGR